MATSLPVVQLAPFLGANKYRVFVIGLSLESNNITIEAAENVFSMRLIGHALFSGLSNSLPEYAYTRWLLTIGYFCV